MERQNAIKRDAASAETVTTITQETVQLSMILFRV
jgi:hypothetical protein